MGYDVSALYSEQYKSYNVRALSMHYHIFITVPSHIEKSVVSTLSVHIVNLTQGPFLAPFHIRQQKTGS